MLSRWHNWLIRAKRKANSSTFMMKGAEVASPNLPSFSFSSMAVIWSISLLNSAWASSTVRLLTSVAMIRVILNQFRQLKLQKYKQDKNTSFPEEGNCKTDKNPECCLKECQCYLISIHLCKFIHKKAVFKLYPSRFHVASVERSLICSFQGVAKEVNANKFCLISCRKCWKMINMQFPSCMTGA